MPSANRPSTAPRPERPPVSRKRAASPRCKAASKSSRSGKTGRKSRPQPEGVWARLRRKLADGAAWAVHDAHVGTVVFFAIYFGSSWVALGGIAVDKVVGTSICNPDWFLRVKLTALGAGLVWGLLILAPAALLARYLRTSSFDAWRDGITKRRVRPIVDALATYAAMLVAVMVWTATPPPGPAEFVVPGPQVYQARLAIINLQIMALRCLEDASPPHCSRPDIRHIQARYFLEWHDKAPPSAFDGRSSWG
jgi:hypothetical protein